MKKGFTLIELLVVVLIIGILAAIALPQYTKAVERSRMAEAVQVLGDLATAQSIYYMSNNRFATGLTGTDSDSAFYLNNGDISVSDAGDAWNAVEIKGTSAGDGVSMTLERANGMYSGGKLQIVVMPSGAISKNCNTSEKADFCSVAKSMGYTGTALTATKS